MSNLYLRDMTSLINHTALTALFLFTISLFTLVIHRLYFHPLSAYPGPIFARLTPFPDVYHAYRGDKHIHFLHLHAKYGPVVRFAPNSLAINDPAALKAIYSHGANVQKSPGFYHGFRASPAAISTLLATEKTHHARKRRILGQAFSEQAMRNLEVYVLENVRTFEKCIADAVEGRGRSWSEGLDMGRLNNWLVFDIMGDLVFGKSLGTLGANTENRDAIRLLGRAARRNYVVGAMPFLWRSGLERWLPLLRGLWSDRLQYFAFGKRQVTERSNYVSLEDDGRKDIFHYLLTAKDPETGEGLPKSELGMEGNTLIVAGSDTSSTTMSATLFYILQDTACLAQLTKEVRSTFDHEEDIHSGSQLQSCSYLRACIDEAMRMSPAVPGLLPRLVLPGGLDIPDLKLHIPAGVDVGTCTYAIQHHADHVFQPFTYNPSRWLQRSNESVHKRQRSDSGVMIQQPQTSRAGHKTGEEDRHNFHQDRDALHSVFAPFSLGNRACLGKPLVYMEISIAIARLVWKYEMRLVDSSPSDAGVKADLRRGRRAKDEYHLRDWFLSANEGPMVEFAARDGA